LNSLFGLSIQVIVFITSFILTIIIGIILIPILTKLKFGQTVRDDGPTTHLVKTGTPTIGGAIFIISIFIISIFYANINPKILALLFVTVGFSLIGFIDDYIKTVYILNKKCLV